MSVGVSAGFDPSVQVSARRQTDLGMEVTRMMVRFMLMQLKSQLFKAMFRRYTKRLASSASQCGLARRSQWRGEPTKNFVFHSARAHRCNRDDLRAALYDTDIEAKTACDEVPSIGQVGVGCLSAHALNMYVGGW